MGYMGCREGSPSPFLASLRPQPSHAKGAPTARRETFVKLQVVSFAPSRSLNLRPRSYFESLSTSGPSPSNSIYAKVSPRERGWILDRVAGYGEGERWVLGQVLDSSRQRRTYSAEPRNDTEKGMSGYGEPPPIPLLRPFDSAHATAYLRQGERNTPPIGMERPSFVSWFMGGNG